MLIGISGKSKSGKDTCFSIIQKLTQNKFENKKFANPVKQIASILLDLPIEHLELQDVKDSLISSFHKNENWSKITPWPNITSTKTKQIDLNVRDMLIGIGDGMREKIHSNIWINKLFRNTFKPEKNWVITDVRYLNEADEILKNNGFLIRINRPNIALIDNKSENDLDKYKNFKYTINNDNDLYYLEWQINNILYYENII